jgi:hypothetical protein
MAWATNVFDALGVLAQHMGIHPQRHGRVGMPEPVYRGEHRANYAASPAGPNRAG